MFIIIICVYLCKRKQKARSTLNNNSHTLNQNVQPNIRPIAYLNMNPIRTNFLQMPYTMPTAPLYPTNLEEPPPSYHVAVSCFNPQER